MIKQKHLSAFSLVNPLWTCISTNKVYTVSLATFFYNLTRYQIAAQALTRVSNRFVNPRGRGNRKVFHFFCLNINQFPNASR